MISSKRNSTGNSHGDVAGDGQDFVYSHVRTSAPVSEIVNAAVKSVVEEASNQISVQK